MFLEKISLSSEDENAYLEAYVADPIKSLHGEGTIPRKAILVIPGGGYSGICSDREGEPIAMAFMPYGYNAFVLHYTVGRKKGFPEQLIQASAAIKHIRDHAQRYHIDPEQLFVVGFSAGGHLAASCGVLWKLDEIYRKIDMPYGYNKPTGVMLAYPVISATLQRHIRSFQNLFCTDEPSAEQLERASIERHVDEDSAPAFIFHTSNDDVVDVKNALLLANAYADAGLTYELHIYPEGPHGMALANAITAGGSQRYLNASIAEWVRHADDWAKDLCEKRKMK